MYSLLKSIGRTRNALILNAFNVARNDICVPRLRQEERRQSFFYQRDDIASRLLERFCGRGILRRVERGVNVAMADEEALRPARNPRSGPDYWGASLARDTR